VFLYIHRFPPRAEGSQETDQRPHVTFCLPSAPRRSARQVVPEAPLALHSPAGHPGVRRGIPSEGGGGGVWGVGPQAGSRDGWVHATQERCPRRKRCPLPFSFSPHHCHLLARTTPPIRLPPLLSPPFLSGGAPAQQPGVDHLPGPTERHQRVGHRQVSPQPSLKPPSIAPCSPNHSLPLNSSIRVV